MWISNALIVAADTARAAPHVDTVTLTGPLHVLQHSPDVEWAAWGSVLLAGLLIYVTVRLELSRRRQQARDTARRRAIVDARISAIAYALRRQLRSWIADAPPAPGYEPRNAFKSLADMLKDMTPDAMRAPRIYDPFVRPVLSWIQDRMNREHARIAERRFEELLAIAPEGDQVRALAVHSAYVDFCRATGEWNRELLHAQREAQARPDHLVAGRDALDNAAATLSVAIAPEWRDETG